MKHFGALLVAASLLAGFSSGWALAQDEEGAKEKKEDSIQKKQQALRDAYKAFEEKLNESANALRKESPEKAQRLQRAYDASRQAFESKDGHTPEAIWQHMEAVIDLLNRKNPQEALVNESEVLERLEAVLEILESDGDPTKNQDRLDPRRLEELKKELERLIKEQKTHKDEIAKARDLETKARAVAEASKKLGEILDLQKKLADKTGDMKPGEAGDLSKEQKELADQTAELQKLMDLVDKIAPGEDDKKPGEGKPGEGKPGEGKPGEGKPGEGKPGEGKPGEGKPGEGKPGEGKPGEGKPGEGKPGEQSPASKNIGSAKDAMDQAGKNIEAEKKPEAQERQRKAIEDLEEARKSLEKKKAVIERLAQIEKKKADLEKIRQDTKDLEKKFGEQAGGQGGQDGKGGKGGKGGQGGKKNQGQVPGKRKIEKAGEEQQRAGDDLENRHIKDAEQKEEEAIKQLEEAEEALREALIQARKREQEETLKALGQHFVVMLEKQKDLTRRTEALDKERTYDDKGNASDLNRKQRKECNQISGVKMTPTEGEAALRDETDVVVELTREEGSSTILPTVLGELREDIARVADLLDKADSGRFVQSVQHDIERTLEELIEVIKKEIEERKNGGGGGGGGGGGDDKNGDPLLPASTELKMIRAQQMRVNNKTKEFDIKRGQPEPELTKDQREACRMIAEKQARVADFTRRLHSKLNKED